MTEEKDPGEKPVLIGIGNIPPVVKGPAHGQGHGKEHKAGHMHAPSLDESRYFAREGVPPLSHAFEGKIAVHPGLGGSKVASEDIPAHLDKLLDQERKGRSVAYFHIPFCRTHCLFCGFYKKKYDSEESRQFTDALIAEMELWRGRKAMEDKPVHAVYFGGGTPTELEAADMERLLKAVRSILPLANDCEITVEGRLSNFDARKMEACFSGGANRFSLGVQSFHTDIRRSMGRMGTQEEMIRGLEQLMRYGHAAVIVDLIYGFPNQTMERWLEDIAIAHSLKLDGADCYQLNVYRHTPLGQAIEKGTISPAADIPQQSAMYAAAVEAMRKAFYRRLSMSHWARTSRERNLYNLYVKSSAHCLAFGPGAGGNLQGHFYINNGDYTAWMQSIQSGEKPCVMVTQPQANHYFFKAVTEGMEQGWLDMSDLERTYGISVEETCKPLLQQWRKVGLVELEEGRLVLTLAGQFWQVNLSQLLQEYLQLQLRK